MKEKRKYFDYLHKKSVFDNITQVLPTFSDDNKMLFVYGSKGDVNGLCELMIDSNKSYEYIMQVNEIPKESILSNICGLGKIECFIFN